MNLKVRFWSSIRTNQTRFYKLLTRIYRLGEKLAGIWQVPIEICLEFEDSFQRNFSRFSGTICYNVLFPNILRKIEPKFVAKICNFAICSKICITFNELLVLFNINQLGSKKSLKEKIANVAFLDNFSWKTF
jgi:hypothetical protein